MTNMINQINAAFNPNIVKEEFVEWAIGSLQYIIGIDDGPHNIYNTSIYNIANTYVPYINMLISTIRSEESYNAIKAVLQDYGIIGRAYITIIEDEIDGEESFAIPACTSILPTIDEINTIIYEEYDKVCDEAINEALDGFIQFAVKNYNLSGYEAAVIVNKYYDLISSDIREIIMNVEFTENFYIHALNIMMEMCMIGNGKSVFENECIRDMDNIVFHECKDVFSE